MNREGGERTTGRGGKQPVTPVPKPPVDIGDAIPLPPYPPEPHGVQVVTPRDVLDRTAARDAQMQVAADNAPLRITYGFDRIGAQVADVLAYNGLWVFHLIWGEGPIAQIVELQMGDAPLPAGVIATHYLGNPGQGVDATLVAAYAAQSPAVAYADDLPGIAYSVVTVPGDTLNGDPRFAATIKGRLLAGLHDHPLSDILTYTRANTHSRYNASGVLEFVAADVLPLDYDPVTHAARGLQIFTGKSNLCTKPEDFSTTWNTNASPNDITVTTNVAGIICPDGSQNADKLIPSANLGAHIRYILFTGAIDTQYCGSVHLKSGAGYRYALVYFGNSAFSNTSRGAYFDLDTGAVSNPFGAVDGYMIEPAPGGFYRCTVLSTSDHDGGNYVFGIGLTNTLGSPNSTGDGVKGVYAWGCDIIAHHASVPYIGTTTRSSPSFAFNNLDWLNSAEGTFVAIGTSKNISTVDSKILAMVGTTDSNNAITLYALDHPRMDVAVSSVQQLTGFDNLGTYTPASAMRIAGAYKANDFAAVENNGALKTDAAGSLPAFASANVGSNLGASGGFFDGWIEFIAYFPAKLSNAELQALSTLGTSYLNSLSVAPTLVLDFIKNQYWLSETAYSDNPSLATGDFIESITYGLSRTVNDASMARAAVENDALIGGKKRRTFGLTIDSVRSGADWLATLATYASAWTPEDAGIYKLVPDRPATVSETFDHAAGDFVALHSLTKRGVLGVPTVVDIRWTDITASPWRERSAVASLTGVAEGTTPRRESVVQLSGIHDYSQAYREAVERLNKLNLADLSGDTTVFDRGITVEIGDIDAFTHPIGISSKQMRILGTASDNGRYRLALSEYDPLMYSDSVATAPSTTDTNLPSPAHPLPVTGLTAVERLFQLANGTWASQIYASWIAPANFPYALTYRVELWQSSTLVDSAMVQGRADYATPPVDADGTITYTFRVYVLTTIAASDPRDYNVTPQGKYLAPSDVPSISGFEAGGNVYLAWQPAIDIDIWRYELRYGAVTDAWEAAILLDRIDALRYQTKNIPVGTWRVFVKCLDSVGLYSANAAHVDVEVSSDSAAFLVDQIDYVSPTLTRMSAYSLARTDPAKYWVTEDGVAFGTKFPSNLSTYTNPLASYSSSGASVWQSESHDFGLMLSGQWVAQMTDQALSGSIAHKLQLSPDNTNWVDYTNLSAKTNARYARLKIDAAGTDVIFAKSPTMHLGLQVIPRDENCPASAPITSSAGGPVRINLVNEYTDAVRIVITPLGTTFASGIADKVGNHGPNAADAGTGINVGDGTTYSVNTVYKTGATAWASVRDKFVIPAGKKCYWEIEINGYGGGQIIGVMDAGSTLNNFVGFTANGWGYVGNTGNRWNNNAAVAYGATYYIGDRIGVLKDNAANTLEFFKYNPATKLMVSQGQLTGVTGTYPAVSMPTVGDMVTFKIASAEWVGALPAGAIPLPFGFDAYVFDAAGALIARQFVWNFQGV